MAEETISWEPFTGTAAALEQPRIDGGEFWMTSAAAGLQYYKYGKPDGLGGFILPICGDRLSLMRRPDNPADGNAIEVWWHNEHHLGHLPRDVAYTLAPQMDRGEPLRAYVFDGGTGEAWSAKILLVGRGVEELHGKRLVAIEEEKEREIEREARVADREVWRIRPSNNEAIPASERRGGQWSRPIGEPRLRPTSAQEAANLRFEREIQARLDRRREDAILGFVDLEAIRGTDFKKWEDVPPFLKTKTELKKNGLKPPKNGHPFAWKVGGYGPYDLWLVSDCR